MNESEQLEEMRHRLEHANVRETKADARAEAAEKERDEAQARVDKWRDGEEYRRLYARSAALEDQLAEMRAKYERS